MRNLLVGTTLVAAGGSAAVIIKSQSDDAFRAKCVVLECLS